MSKLAEYSGHHHMTWVQDQEAASAARTRNTELGIETVTCVGSMIGRRKEFRDRDREESP